MNDIAQRLAGVLDRIREAERAAGRPEGSVELVAVSKTHPAERVRAAFDAGQRIFGESRAQEALAKVPLLPQAARWHFIGHLQSNKIRKVLPHFELFHGVDSPELAASMDRVAGELGLRARILLEVNVGGEGTKFGFQPDKIDHHMESLLTLRHVDVEGVMAIPPPVENPADARPYFARLRELRARLERDFAVTFPTLSMGMSHDYAEAIAEGATLVRVGTAIFGER